MVQIHRYAGIGKESTYGQKVQPAFHLNPSALNLDSPSEPVIHFDGGLGRFPRRTIPAAYITAGSIDFAADVSTFWYLLWLTLGLKSTDSAGVTPVAAEAIGSTDVSGDLTVTLANPLVDFASLEIVDSGSDKVAVDDGSGFVRAVTPVTGEQFTTGAAETTKTVQLVNFRIVPDTLFIIDGVQVAHDDGAGVIAPDASTVAGTIDYENGLLILTGLDVATTYDIDYRHVDYSLAHHGTVDYLTGDLVLTGLGVSEAHTADYDYGYYVHTITAQNDDALPSFTARLGKDLYEQVFAGCAVNSLTASLARELLDVSLDVVGGPDTKETIVDLEDMRYGPEYPVAFHKVSFSYGNKGGALSPRNCPVNSINTTISNNADAEGALGLNSRFPCQSIFAGNLDIIIDLVLKFDSTQDKEDFWGSPTGPSDTLVEKIAQLTFDAGLYGNIVLDFPRLTINTVGHAPSGRTKMDQSIQLKVQFDPVTQEMIVVTATTLTNWQ